MQHRCRRRSSRAILRCYRHLRTILQAFVRKNVRTGCRCQPASAAGGSGDSAVAAAGDAWAAALPPCSSGPFPVAAPPSWLALLVPEGALAARGCCCGACSGDCCMGGCNGGVAGAGCCNSTRCCSASCCCAACGSAARCRCCGLPGGGSRSPSSPCCGTGGSGGLSRGTLPGGAGEACSGRAELPQCEHVVGSKGEAQPTGCKQPACCDNLLCRSRPRLTLAKLACAAGGGDAAKCRVSPCNPWSTCARPSACRPWHAHRLWRLPPAGQRPWDQL